MDGSKKKAGKPSPQDRYRKALSLLAPLLCLAVGALCLVYIADLAQDNVDALMRAFRLTISR